MHMAKIINMQSMYYIYKRNLGKSPKVVLFQQRLSVSIVKPKKDYLFCTLCSLHTFN